MSSVQAVPTVGKYAVQALTVAAAQAIAKGTASTDRPRRHHRLVGQPATATTRATPASPIHTHTCSGGGTPARPADRSNHRDAPATPTPTAADTGSQTLLHRRVRHPAVKSTAVTAATSRMVGIAPPVNDSCSRYATAGEVPSARTETGAPVASDTATVSLGAAQRRLNSR